MSYKFRFHGIFNTIDDIVGLVDEAYAKILARSPDVSIFAETENSITYLVEMGKEIGKKGGRDGNLEPLSNLRIAFEKVNGEITSNIITAFPD